eukprot:SAG25_NODE_79_length_16803_cov_43.538194_6_plen_223_part_00
MPGCHTHACARARGCVAGWAGDAARPGSLSRLPPAEPGGACPRERAAAPRRRSVRSSCECARFVVTEMLVPPSSSRLCWATNLRRRTGSWRERATRRQAELATLRSQQLLLAQQATDSRQLVVEMATTRRGRGRRGRLRPNANANAVAAVGGERGLGMGAPRHRVHGGGGGGSAPAAPCSSSARRRGRVGGGAAPGRHTPPCDRWCSQLAPGRRWGRGRCWR